MGEPIAADQPLMAAGLDSLAATELQQGLSETLGLPLPPTLVFDYPTISALVAHLTALAAGQTEPADVAVQELNFARQDNRSHAAAVMGIAGEHHRML